MIIIDDKWNVLEYVSDLREKEARSRLVNTTENIF